MKMQTSGMSIKCDSLCTTSHRFQLRFDADQLAAIFVNASLRMAHNYMCSM